MGRHFSPLKLLCPPPQAEEPKTNPCPTPQVSSSKSARSFFSPSPRPVLLFLPLLLSSVLHSNVLSKKRRRRRRTLRRDTFEKKTHTASAADSSTERCIASSWWGEVLFFLCFFLPFLHVDISVWGFRTACSAPLGVSLQKIEGKLQRRRRQLCLSVSGRRVCVCNWRVSLLELQSYTSIDPSRIWSIERSSRRFLGGGCPGVFAVRSCAG